MLSDQRGFVDVEDRYKRLSEAGDRLEKLDGVVGWVLVRKPLEKALKHLDRVRGGRPLFDAVMMFKIFVAHVLYNLSDDQTEFQIFDRLSFMRFLGLSLRDNVPDAKMIGLYREHRVEAGAINKLFDRQAVCAL